jgi:AcrR family transcriptional regulator
VAGASRRILERSENPMPTTPHTVRLASEDLRDHRHVCALVDGPDDAYDLLTPFIVDGFEQGDRAVHLVDPLARDAHLARLADAGIDVAAAMAAGQLDVRTWTDSYLLGGRFDRPAQLALLRRLFAEGRTLGFPMTRAIGMMEWALDSVTAADLLRYEAGVNDVLRKVPDVVVCTYDLRRHSARTIAEVLGVHPAAVVGGILRVGHPPAPASARDRLVAAASHLFHDTGIQATGVDSIIEAAGVAKATFYRHFPSKEDLVVAWLRDPSARWLDRLGSQVEASRPEPLEAIPLFFEAVAEWLEAEDYRGCPYLNTAVEITNPTHPARLVVREFLQDVEDYLTGLAEAAGYRHPRMLATQLQTLLAGSIILAVARRSSAFALTAREAAMKLLAAAD